MTYAEITELLDRYWEGETSLEEEQKLREYFNSGVHDLRLDAVAPLFRALQAEQSLALANTTPARLYVGHRAAKQWTMAAAAALFLGIGTWWLFQNGSDKPESPLAYTQALKTIPAAPPVPLHNPPLQPEKNPNKKSIILEKRNKISQKERKEAQKAYEALKAALALVSSKLSKGRIEAAKNLNHLEALDIIKKKKETTG